MGEERLGPPVCSGAVPHGAGGDRDQGIGRKSGEPQLVAGGGELTKEFFFRCLRRASDSFFLISSLEIDIATALRGQLQRATSETSLTQTKSHLQRLALGRQPQDPVTKKEN